MKFSPESFHLQRYIQAPIHLGELLIFVLLTSLVVTGAVSLLLSKTPNDDLPTVNKLFRYEPAIFARFRWIANAQAILRDADKEVGIFPFVKTRNICCGLLIKFWP